MFSFQYVASKDIQTSDLKRVGNTKLRETISEIRISSRLLMPIDAIEMEGGVCKFFFFTERPRDGGAFPGGSFLETRLGTERGPVNL